jgi:hypothetical protein
LGGSSLGSVPWDQSDSRDCVDGEWYFDNDFAVVEDIADIECGAAGADVDLA